jgi:AcrR family transcriptional regulator
LNTDNSTNDIRPRHGLKRREEYAQATRQAILDAARRLFRERGYFSTKVDEIAALARVAPATVYAVSGGKHGLLNTLIEIWTTAPLVPTALERIAAMDDPAAILRVVAAGCRSMREEFGDIVCVTINTAPHDPAISESLNAATARYRQACAAVAQRLSELGTLRDGIDLKNAVDVLWFYFGHAGFAILHDENGWSYERAEQWLCHEATRALLGDRIHENHRNGLLPEETVAKPTTPI